MGTQPSLPKKGAEPPPQFSAHVYCGQTAVCIRIPLGTEVGLSLGDIVLDGNSAPPRKGAQQRPPLLAHVYCGQTAGWIKIPLSREVGFSLGDIVLDGDPAPPPQKGNTPNFRPLSVVAKWLGGSRCHLVLR